MQWNYNSLKNNVASVHVTKQLKNELSIWDSEWEKGNGENFVNDRISELRCEVDEQIWAAGDRKLAIYTLHRIEPSKSHGLTKGNQMNSEYMYMIASMFTAND